MRLFSCATNYRHESNSISLKSQMYNEYIWSILIDGSHLCFVRLSIFRMSNQNISPLKLVTLGRCTSIRCRILVSYETKARRTKPTWNPCIHEYIYIYKCLFTSTHCSDSVIDVQCWHTVCVYVFVYLYTCVFLCSCARFKRISEMNECISKKKNQEKKI